MRKGELKNRVVRGALAYSGRQFIITGLNLVTNLVLTRILFPADFGYAATISVVVSFAFILSEGGLGVYLVQRCNEIADTDISRIISLQFFLYLVFQICLAVGVLVVWLLRGDYYVWLLLCVAGLSMPFSLLRSASLILLERSLRFQKIAVVESSEQVMHAVVAIGLALMGFGVWSIVIASLARSLFGWQFARHYAPWKLTISHHPGLDSDLRSGIRFGLTYQLPAILETVRAAINPLFVGSLLGLASVGYIDRAVIVASMPLALMGGVWRKVLFPYFARIQDDLHMTRRVFEESIYLHSVLDKAAYLPLIIFCPELVQIVLGAKWLPIVPLIYVFLFGNVLFGAISTTSMAILTGLGRPGVLARWSVVQVVAAWVLAIPLVSWFGMIGYAYVSVFLWVGIIYTSIHVRRLIGRFDLVRPLSKPFLAFTVSVVLVRLVVVWTAHASLSWVAITALSALSLAIYTGILLLIDWHHLSVTIQRLHRNSRSFKVPPLEFEADRGTLVQERW